ncbi:MAG: hypothetical protein M3Q27_09865 [Actinomycetota bacterium]|nr:hypothetical protein [Actinomycetota bacterium]
MADPNEQDLRDLGGEIGKGDTTAGRGDPNRPQPQVDVASAMAVDSLPDSVRTGQYHQDETDVVQQGKEVRHIDPDKA